MGIWKKLFKPNRSGLSIAEAIASVDPIQEMRTIPRLATSAPFDYLANGEHSSIVNRNFRLWFTNTLLKRYIEIYISYIIGDGFEVKAENEELQNYLDEWMADELVDFANQAKKYANDYMIAGECALLPEIEEVNGFVRWCPFDITSVSRVHRAYGKALYADAVIDGALKTMRIIRKDRDPRNATNGYLVGDMALLQNVETNMLTRGYPALMRLADDFEAYEEFRFGEISRAMLLRKFLLHTKITGSSKEERAAYAKAHPNAPTSGSNLVTDENWSFEFLTPDLDADSADQLGQTVKNHLNAGAGTANWMMGEGGEANRAEADRMSKPILRSLMEKQTTVMQFFKLLLTFVRDQAVLSGGALRGLDITAPENQIEVIPDSINEEDVSVELDNFTKLVNALSMAVTAGFASKKTGEAAVNKGLEELGVEVTPVAEETNQALAQMQEAHREAVKLRKAG